MQDLHVIELIGLFDQPFHQILGFSAAGADKDPASFPDMTQGLVGRHPFFGAHPFPSQ